MENNYVIAKYLVTVMPDVCIANGKDPSAITLANKLTAYGEVTPFEEVEEKIRAEFQGVIDNLTTQLRAIQNQELTEDEILFLNFYRERKAVNGEVYQRKIDLLENGIEEMRIASLKRAEQIALLAEQLREMGA